MGYVANGLINSLTFWEIRSFGILKAAHIPNGMWTPTVDVHTVLLHWLSAYMCM